MKDEKEIKQKGETDEKAKEKQKTIMLIGLFFAMAIVFAISGVGNVLYGNKAAGVDKILGAIALVALGIWYIVRDHRK
ncbi:MAG: hypothetical protein Q4E73_09040 [Lachnospiraceae bacterium]|nr:hypothetical protein [Lachnospiraceae bacterium]